MAVEMLSYLDRKSLIHNLTGVTKLLCFIMWSFASMLTYDTRILFFLLIGSILVFIISKIKIADVAFVLVFILIFLFINNLAIYIFSPQEGVKIYKTQHVLFTITGSYNITIEQLFYQLNITLKYLTVIPAALLFMVTTHPSEFASSLNRIGVSYSIAFAVALALRYIPDVQRDYRTIALAQQARGLDMSRKEKLPKRFKNAVLIIFPLVLSSLDRIETISNAMDLRGFGKNKKRTWYSARPFRRNDYLALLLIGMVFVLSITVTFYDGNRFYNPFL
ncbi:energy-coupling factor transporter transmembrane component T family protein [Neobacillus dielmonensis]|uniref:energy-coupling factor transporter transmembrane component T family protein n=1 Tax=Neobacillus dielmonensis TaxID=1347369 RepID=UPI0005A79DF4|nr:energy-coupling factor transporter transmembrane component T [Neobacillus dielmonensis]